jgi:hypothetical protein
MSNKLGIAFARTATLFSRRFGWVCAGTLAALGVIPHANAAVPRLPSNQAVQVNSIPERLRIVREGLGTEEPQKVERKSRAARFTQWYNGRSAR